MNKNFAKSLRTRLASSAAVLIAMASVAPLAGAADIDPSGTWSWTRAGRNGNEVTNTLKLKASGQQVTGMISGRNNRETAIEKGSIQGDELRFEVTREVNGTARTTRYAGKIEGNSLKGTVKSTNRNGEEQSREWTAKRTPAGPDGRWKYSFTTGNGNTIEPVMALKSDGEKITGTVKVNEFEMPLEGTYKDGKLALTIKGERDGQTWSTQVAGKIEGDKMIAKSTSNWNGQERVRDIEATRVKE
ncbi:MAG: hypothetical protein AB7O66_24745 [Limisphaerales bacterium]